MLVNEYGDYLGTVGLSKKTIAIYRGRLQIFLNNGYSENDLKGAVDELISKHSKGGEDYNQKDSGNTVAALRKLKDYIRAPYVENFFIAYDRGFSSAVPVKRYVSAYTITDGAITITYKKGHCFEKTVTRNIPKVHYGQLIDLVIKYKDYLSQSNTAMNTVHGPGPAYRYVFGNDCGSNCEELFVGQKGDTEVIRARDAYLAWIKRFIP